MRSRSIIIRMSEAEIDLLDRISGGNRSKFIRGCIEEAGGGEVYTDTLLGEKGVYTRGGEGGDSEGGKGDRGAYTRFKNEGEGGGVYTENDEDEEDEEEPGDDLDDIFTTPQRGAGRRG